MLRAIFLLPVWQPLGYALLHSLWQGVVVAASLALLLTYLKRQSAEIRYLASIAALLLLLALPVATFYNLNRQSVSLAVDETKSQPISATAAAAQTVSVDERNAPKINSGVQLLVPLHSYSQSDRWLPWFAFIWLAGVLLLSLRNLGGILYAHRIARQDINPVATEIEQLAVQLAQRLSLNRSVRIFESVRAQVPLAIGYLRPVILLPASALTGLSSEQLAAIIAHELAHIRRHDYFINLLQTVVETLLFYHPAAWWISRQIRNEREHACDDIAVSLCGSPLVYARALTALERMRKADVALAMAATGKGSLLARIERLVSAPPPSSLPSLSSIFLPAIIALCLSALSVQAVLLNNHAEKVAAKTTSNAVSQSAKANPVQFNNTNSRIAKLIANDQATGEDLAIRAAAINALGNYEGCAVVMNPRDGRVYSIVNQNWAVRRGWVPASTIKVITSLAMVGEKTSDPSEQIRFNAKAEPLDLAHALALSNTEYFQFTGERIGSERFIKYAHKAGIGELTGLNIENENPGRLPELKAVKNPGNLAAYGEGALVTPIQLATFISALANGGTLLVPHTPQTEVEAANFQAQIKRSLDIPRDVIQTVINGLADVTRYGTASDSCSPEDRVVGKTGTMSERSRNVGMFASYAPLDNPRYTVVVLIRGKEVNGRLAAKIAGEIYRTLNIH